MNTQITDSGHARAWIEISRGALAANAAFLKSRLPEHCRLMPAVKAEAYGHGAVPVARELSKAGVDAFCVACVQEGVALREAGIEGEILVLGYTHPEEFYLLEKYRISQTVVDREYARLLSGYGRKLHVHVGIDTGMRRLGERSDEISGIIDIFRTENLVFDGIFTHLSADDRLTDADIEFTLRQAREFDTVVSAIADSGFPVPKRHLLASYGVVNYPQLGGDYARIGLALYGMLGTTEDTEPWKTFLTPVMSLRARIATVRELYAGESAGYGNDFTADKNMRIATVTIGYADGYPRSLSNGAGRMLINGRYAPIIGRICMDQTSVDVTDIPDARQGGIATLIGRDGENEITACELADKAGTITNEILSRMGTRIERFVTE